MKEAALFTDVRGAVFVWGREWSRRVTHLPGGIAPTRTLFCFSGISTKSDGEDGLSDIGPQDFTLITGRFLSETNSQMHVTS